MNKNGISNLKTILLIIFILIPILRNSKDLYIPNLDITMKDVWLSFINILIIIFMTFVSFSLRRYKKIYSINIMTCIYLNAININYMDGFFVKTWNITYFVCYLMKTISFLAEQKEKEKCKHFLYFLAIPSLCYKTKYKKKSNRSFHKISELIFKAILAAGIFIFIKDNFLISYLEELTTTDNLSVFLASYFSLSICVVFCWLSLFYFYFVCYLNILAELTYYKDDFIYLDWWNTGSIDCFWQKWNVPFHRWTKRYIFNSLTGKGYKKIVAKAMCFLLSGLAHEYGISLCCGKTVGWMFLGMLGQIPMSYFCKLFESNFCFWIVFCIFGQTFSVFMIYRKCLGPENDMIDQICNFMFRKIYNNN